MTGTMRRKDDGTYVVEFRTARDAVLAIAGRVGEE
jgi:hypothetical protein